LRPSIELLLGFLLISLPFLALVLLEESPAPRIEIDGLDSDWAAVHMTLRSDHTASANANVSLVRYGHVLETGRLSFALEVEGTVFGDTRDTAAYFLIDIDGDTTTGFPITDIGVDRGVQVLGSHGSVNESIVFVWPGGDGLEWSGWKFEGFAAAASQGSFLEVQLPDDAGVSSESVTRVALTDFLGNETLSSIPNGASPVPVPPPIIPIPIPITPRPWPVPIPEFPAMPVTLAITAAAGLLLHRRRRSQRSKQHLLGYLHG
jgi:hypothetical protein